MGFNVRLAKQEPLIYALCVEEIDCNHLSANVQSVLGKMLKMIYVQIAIKHVLSVLVELLYNAQHVNQLLNYKTACVLAKMVIFRTNPFRNAKYAISFASNATALLTRAVYNAIPFITEN